MPAPSSSARRDFVVRARELDDLLAGCRTLQRGQSSDSPAFAFIDGFAGVGKTRLVKELIGALAPQRPIVVVAQCFEQLQAPYAPFIEALGALARAVAPATSPWRHVAKNPLLDVPAAAPAPSRADAARLQRFALTAEFLRDAAEVRPLLLVIEDVQWADDASLDLLRHIVRSLAGVRAYVVATARLPQDRQTPWRARLVDLQRDAALHVRLDPFTPAQMRRFLGSATKSRALGLSAEVLDRIERLADGNAFTAEELLRDAASSRGTSGGAVPASLGASILARLDDFSIDDRGLLSHAAVLGRHFDVSLLAHTSGISSERVAGVLRRAVTVGLLDDADAGAAFTFRHALTQDTLYRMLAPEHARELHAAVAARLEDSDGGGDASVLAYHFSAAGDGAKAFFYNTQAGSEAESVYAFRDAARFYRRAIECAEEGEPRAWLYERVAACLGQFGDLAGAREASQSALDAYGESAQAERVIPLLIDLSSIALSMGDADAALRSATDALTLANERGADAARFRAHQQLGGVTAYLGEPLVALAHLDEAARTPEAVSTENASNLHGFRAYALSLLGRYREALGEYRSALDFARHSEDPAFLVRILNNFASRASLIGDLHLAQSLYQEAIGVATQRNLERLARLLIHNFASVQLTLGNLVRAKDLYYEGLAYQAGALVTRISSASLAIRIGLLDGDDDLIERNEDPALLEEAFASRQQQNIGDIAGTMLALYAMRGQDAAARSLRGRAVSALTGTDFAFWCLDDIAVYGDPDELERARALLMRDAATNEHATASAYLLLFDARTAARAGKAASANPPALRAVEAFRRLGWPLEMGWALELAGQPDGALEAYRMMGATRVARRLERDLDRPASGSATAVLSKREHEIAGLVADGYSTRQIGERLSISERTVETHLQSIFRKLELKSRIQLASFVLSERARG